LEVRKEKVSEMKKRLISIALLVAVMTAFAFGPMVSVQAAPLKQALAIPVTGTFTDALGGTGQFVGSFDVQRFVVRQGVLTAIGTLTGTLTDSLGNVVGTISRTIALPVTNITAVCEILHLELGPLDLNLLGLMVHLDQVVLDITAQPGGGLLGDLLCAIANLLDGGGTLNQIARLLNNILRILG
jgi:hypothetical protein